MTTRKKFDELKSTFNIDVEAEEVSSEIIVVDNTINEKEKFDKDVAYVFGVLTSTIEKSKEALDCALELAQETDSARAYEVVSQLAKQTVDSAEKIVDIYKKVKDVKEEKSGPTNVTNNNAVFVGTTAEALKLLKAEMSENS